MLLWLKIRNLALIEETEIEFTPGLNVISGETGAGKTVFMSAISMLLGERADKGMIRAGTDFCEISAGLRIGGNISVQVNEILERSGIPFNTKDNEILLKRIIGHKSSRNFINDSSCSLQTMSDLGDILIDTHGPHEHQSLLKPSIQLAMLDNYSDLEEELIACSAIYNELKKSEDELAQIMNRRPSEEELSLMRITVNEIDAASVLPGEDDAIVRRHKLAAESHDIIRLASSATSVIDNADGSVTDKIAGLFRLLRELDRLDPERGSGFLKQCQNLKDSASSLSSELGAYTERIELDEKEFAFLEERLKILQSLKRRYGPSLDDVINRAEEARGKIKNAENFGAAIKTAENKISLARKLLDEKCSLISIKRKKKSSEFAEKVCSELKKLGFLKSSFRVIFSKTDAGSHGWDKIEFMFSANPGENELPLKDVASSGEISRLMLALKTVLAESDSVPVLVFDEIDVNIGGLTAGTVGKELRKLGKTHQVLCITHLAQVAASGNSHFRVDKSVSDDRTFTKIVQLDKNMRKAEITRMLGGTKAAAKHAEELLKDNAAP